VPAAELLSGNDDPRAHAAGLFRRALAALPEQARARRVRLRADASYFAGELARVAFSAKVVCIAQLRRYFRSHPFAMLDTGLGSVMRW
jgi:hypothetical protein